METDTTKADVLRLVVEQTGVVPEKIHPSSRLLHDLGMDGDDAVDFFNRVHERFGTDLTHLHEHWSEHFGPEGFSCWNGLVIIPAAIMSGVVAGVAGLATFWAGAMTVALLVAWVWAMRRWGPPDRTIPVTVGQVVAAVEAGVWPSSPRAWCPLWVENGHWRASKAMLEAHLPAWRPPITGNYFARCRVVFFKRGSTVTVAM